MSAVAPLSRRPRVARRLLLCLIGMLYVLGVIGLLETTSSAHGVDPSSDAITIAEDLNARDRDRKGPTVTPTKEPTPTPYTGPSPTPTPTVYPLGPLAHVFGLRAEDRIGCRNRGLYYTDDDLSECLEEYGLNQMAETLPATGWVSIPRTSTKFVVPDLPADPNEDGTVDVAITFSALILTELQVVDAPVYVRALIDGQPADPGNIVISDGETLQQYHVRSFTFSDKATPGIHIVEMQWLSPETSVHVRDASVEVIIDHPEGNLHDLAVRSSNGTDLVQMNQAVWTDVPDTLQVFEMPENGEVAFTFAASFKMTQGDFFMVRPVIDGVANAEPPSIELGGRVFHREARSATFTVDGLAPGWHQVKYQWRGSLTDEIAMAEVRGYTSRVLAGPKQTDSTSFDVSVQPGQDMALKGQGYVPLTGLTEEIELPGNSELSLTFSGAVTGWQPVFVAPMLDGEVQSDLEVMVHYPANYCDGVLCGDDNITDAGARSYTFSFKNMSPGVDPLEIGMAMRASESESAWGIVWNATMTVLRQPYVGPDLAVGANMGGGSKKKQAIIEPMRGSRPTLAIVIDPQREDQPEADADYMNGIEELVFGASPSAKKFYAANSGGRLDIVKAGPGVLGPYETQESADHYWTPHSCVGDADEAPGDEQHGVRSGFGELVAEALAAADDDFDFSAYDNNRDGVINSDELAVIVVTPQESAGGSSAVSNFKINCESPTGFYSEDGPDGTRIRQLLHWYTPGVGDDLATAVASANVLNHELGHLIPWLDDAYGVVPVFRQGPNIGQVCDIDGVDAGDPDCQKRVVPTAPDMISLMSRSGSNLPHVDGFHKVQMGWVTPESVIASGTYTLSDVKTDGRVMILPRLNAPHLEYFLLETRIEDNNLATDRYDYGINDDGLAIYHVIEPTAACPGDPEGCATAMAPMCVPQGVWDNHFANFVRTGLRLIQPDGGHRLICDPDGVSNCYTETWQTLWGGVGQSIWQDGPISCPPVIGEPYPDGGAPQLRWSDGTPSGYKILNIGFGVGGGMVFDLETAYMP